MRISAKTVLPAIVAVVALGLGSVNAESKNNGVLGQLPNVTDLLNKQLAEYSVSGFKSWSWIQQKLKINGKEVVLKDWMKDVLPTFNTIADKIPGGYVLQVTGHANRPPEKVKESVLVKLSDRRAKYVYDQFRKLGLTTSKLTYKGVGTEEFSAGSDNRRVSFKVVKN